MSTESNRKDYLEWLKVMASLLLVFAHALSIYHFTPFFVEGQQVVWIELLVRFLEAWFMPLFCVIAGIAAYHSVAKRGASVFRRERFMRLFVPMLFGIVALLPFVGYVAYRFHNPETELSFWQYLPTFFVLDPKSIEGYTGGFSVGHLWFLLYLFIYAMVSGPLFHFLGKERQPGKFWILPLLFAFLAVFLGKMTLLPYPNPFYFLAYFWIGFYMGRADLSSGVFEPLKRYPAIYVLIAMTTMTALLYIRWLYLPGFGPVWVYFAVQPLYVLNALMWVLMILHFGGKYLPRTNPIVQYLGEASLYIYIAHMVPVIYFGYLLIGNVPPALAVIVNTLVSYVVLFIVYEALVRRISILRVLFGMRVKKS